jgi:hypothetical protein
MISPAIATIDARCEYFALAIVGFTDVKTDPGGAYDSKLTGFGCFWPE